jgi:predicted RND superfamily exporter protein
MMSEIMTFVPFVALMFAVTALGVIQGKRELSRQRLQDLHLVERALEAHYKAVDVLSEDPATTPEMLKTVAMINHAMTDRDFVRYFFSHSSEISRGIQRQGGNSTAAFRQVEKLKASRPDLANAYHSAIANALTVFYLRWPGQSAAYRDFVAGAFSEPQEEVAVARKIIDLRFTKSRNDDWAMPGAAMA